MSNFDITTAINLEEGVAGSTVSFLELFQVLALSNNEILKIALPCWAGIHGLTSILYYTNKNEAPGAADALALLGNLPLLLVAQSGFDGTNACFICFAVAAACEFLQATYQCVKLYKKINDETIPLYDTVSSIADRRLQKEIFYDALATAIARGLALIGWIILALGNPIGWGFIAAQSLICLYKAVPPTSNLIYGFFSHRQISTQPSAFPAIPVVTSPAPYTYAQ